MIMKIFLLVEINQTMLSLSDIKAYFSHVNDAELTMKNTRYDLKDRTET